MSQFVDILLLLIFIYVVAYNLATLTLLTLSLSETSAVARARRARVARGPHTPPPLQPSITVVIPAYNEELVIVASVGSILAGTYEPLRVVVVDDGSTDGTSAALDAAYDLVELPIGGGFGLETEPIERLSISRRDPRLRVVRKANGGRSDAVNAGIAVARHDLVAVTDADSVLEPDASRSRSPPSPPTRAASSRAAASSGSRTAAASSTAASSSRGSRSAESRRRRRSSTCAASSAPGSPGPG